MSFFISTEVFSATKVAEMSQDTGIGLMAISLIIGIAIAIPTTLFFFRKYMNMKTVAEAREPGSTIQENVVGVQAATALFTGFFCTILTYYILSAFFG